MSGLEVIASLLTLAETCHSLSRAIRDTAQAKKQVRKQCKALGSRARQVKTLASDIRTHGNLAMTKKSSKLVKKTIHLLDEFNQKTKYLSTGYVKHGLRMGCLEVIKRYIRSTLHHLRWGFHLSRITKTTLRMQEIESKMNTEHSRAMM
jgi:hypothetical protein